MTTLHTTRDETHQPELTEQLFTAKVFITAYWDATDGPLPTAEQVEREIKDAVEERLLYSGQMDVARFTRLKREARTAYIVDDIEVEEG